LQPQECIWYTGLDLGLSVAWSH